MYLWRIAQINLFQTQIDAQTHTKAQLSLTAFTPQQPKVGFIFLVHR
jgi:hypothetical protein